MDGFAAGRALLITPLPPTYSGSKYFFQATVSSGLGAEFNGEYGERSLIALLPDHNTSRGMQGEDTWYRDEIYFPSSFQPTRNTTWNWLYELHNFPNGPCCANFALSVVTDSEDGGAGGGMRLSMRVMGGGDPSNPIDRTYCNQSAGCGEGAYWNPDAVWQWIKGPTLQYGHWYDFVWHVHWDWRSTASSGQGLVEYFVDGTKMGTYSGPTLFYYANNGTGAAGPGQAYMEEGFYRPLDSGAGYAQPTVQVYHAGSMLGPTAASIGESVH